MARLIERGIFCVATVLAAALVATEALPCDLPPPESASVAAVLDGETLKLADGRIVKLIGSKAPDAPLGWRGEDPWPFVEEAKAALEALAANRAIELRFGGSRTDRHGYLLAQVFVAAGDRRLWLQEELVGKGLARVSTSPAIGAATSPSALRGKMPPPSPPPGSIRRRSPASASACAAGSPGGTAP
jgi:micrococcal nuclease